MGWENKKDQEITCLRIAQKCVHLLRGYSIDYSRSKAGQEEERPDFILINECGDKIGIEHFLIDTLTKREKAKSRIIEADKRKLYEKYKDGKYEQNKDGAAKELFDVSFEIFQGMMTFEFHEFAKEFLRIVDKHVKNIDEYKKGNRFSRFGFLCEVRVPTCDYGWWVSTQNVAMHYQVIKGLPMTPVIWQKISKLLVSEMIDFFIVVTIPVVHEEIATVKIYTRQTQQPKLYSEFHF